MTSSLSNYRAVHAEVADTDTAADSMSGTSLTRLPNVCKKKQTLDTKVLNEKFVFIFNYCGPRIMPQLTANAKPAVYLGNF